MYKVFFEYARCYITKVNCEVWTKYKVVYYNCKQGNPYVTNIYDVKM